MIGFAQNNTLKTHTGAYRIGESFNLPKYKEHPFFHAESHLISQLMDRYNTICSNWSIVVMRINRRGLILGSKPCENCDKLLKAVGLNNIYYSKDDGSFTDSFDNSIFIESLTNSTLLV